ncbi:MAG: hypothetical protein QM817_33895 [Archangium sp.]
MNRTLVVALMVVSFVAHAVECPAPKEAADGSLAHQSAEERLAFLSTRFTEESDAAKRWTGIWGGAYGALTVAQLALIGVFPKEESPDWIWGALSSGVGVAFTVLGPLEVLDAGPVFAKRAAANDASDAQKTCQLLAEGERMLREGNDAERFQRSWLIHAGNVLFNIGIGLVLGLGYGRWTSAAINALSGIAIGELTIFTAPNQLISGWESYTSKGAGNKAAPVTLHLVPTAGPGLGVLLRF